MHNEFDMYNEFDDTCHIYGAKWVAIGENILAFEPHLQLAIDLAEERSPLATGGIALGLWELRDDGVRACHVWDFIEVFDPLATEDSYERRWEPAKTILDVLHQYAEEDSVVDYVGEWHSHPRRGTCPSPEISTVGRPEQAAFVVLEADDEEWGVIAAIQRPLPDE